MSLHNPAGTNGFEFLEFTTQDSKKLIQQFTTMGFKPVAHHATMDISLFQQNNIRFLLNNEKNTYAAEFSKKHGASICAMGFRVSNAAAAFEHILAKGARPFDTQHEESPYAFPAIYGVGNSLIYLIDDENNHLNQSSHFKNVEQNTSKGAGLSYIDHVTHNLFRGNMDKWAEFYTNLFNFREIRYFDIEGKLTGLKSRAMTSPCGKIRIPLNESSDDKSQIEEFLKDFNGEGIQHIALGTDTIYETIESLRRSGLEFMETPDTYYELLEKRLPNHHENIERMKENRILIDGNTQGETKLLLQIFTKTMLGPVFFEIIQRKGDEGFGEGNFRALFESIELDQIKRGVLKT